ncbi:UDP-N-acetyl-D-mannosamine dehydrogenase [Sulfuriroseicoccus oceanibius]|uniref:UDP-N-acetyl-D-mannosamine dehydrogenase n=1 Tax=Sulfuriroseicoccus oceanibius TaxID=2707525 RepID=A0A6B3L0S4_9BACT|nr:UDP-N-acetyl-D-mannosamine dehydrogenase [Sulfuriroseicoccus oceanibius]QQL44308.1 UDP-N-acetyl-D-mannosamine dehydrogenase [Sulfuriroseicoccus oceanibius]
MNNYDICVLGLGYIGLPTASIFSTKGKKVLGVDVVQSVVDTINDGRIHIEEPDLDLLVRAAVQSGNLTAAVAPAVADVFIIAVPTPFDEREDGSRVPDLKYVEAATRSIAPVVKPGDLVILESTSPVGTTEKVRDWLIDELVKQGNTEANEKDYHFVHCPERILPGQMLKELVTNDRISGGLTPEAAQKAKELYECFCTAEIFLTDARSAEMSKLTENSFRDVNIAFANELSMVCDELDMDVWEVIKLSNRHPRVNILNPGPGVGGHCIAVDPWFIVDAAPERARLIRTAREVNESKPEYVLAQIQRKADRLKDPVIACLGLAFKANVDDLRESPALDITKQVAGIEGARVLVAEPHITELPKALEGKCELMDAEDAIKAADIVVLLVDHKSFASLSKPVLAERMIIDTRGFWK